MPPMNQDDAVARWGATMHSINELEQHTRRLYEALKQMHAHEVAAARPAIEIATYDVRRAHDNICNAIKVLNTVAVKPREEEPHKPVGEL